MTPDIALNDGTLMPQLGLGVWQTAPDETADVVRQAIELGYRAVDTAAMYGNEEGVGEATRNRPDIFVTTKLWQTDHGFDAALRAFEGSARRLNRPLDLYLIHWPAPRKNLYVETWKALIRLKEEGRVRAVGVSNFQPEHLRRIVGETGVAPAVNQVELHPLFQQRALRAFHDEHGIRTESWSPLGKGRLMEEPVIARIAGKHGKTPAQVIIRWHLDSGLIVIPKSVNPKRLQENVSVFDFSLDADDLGAMAGLDSPDGRMGPNPDTADF